MTRLSLSKKKISILLLEGVHDTALELFRERGYANIESLPAALDEDLLIERIGGVHVLGIRSRTQLTPRVLEAANKLFCVGCFCIGTNQVDLDTARRLGVPVFNAPYSNTRSVAELVLGEIIMLMRGVFPKSMLLHRGGWMKSAKGCHEMRGKVLGIVGYGHIGSQLSVLAESLGMRVIYYDIIKKLALGNARSCSSLDDVLEKSDVVSLHVPDTPATRGMIGAAQIARMRKGSHLVNASRGKVVAIEPLAEALRSGRLDGAAIDVFPVEPVGNDEEFCSPLRGIESAILTPHIGGSTIEAQANIGAEVADKLIDYSDNGSTIGAVNFVPVSLPIKVGGARFLHIHRNVPGMLRAINEVFSARDINISAQYLQTDAEIGYVVVDVDGQIDEKEVLGDLRRIEGTVRARFLWDGNELQPKSNGDQA
ncbi:phosphoglycerate dehydrogenase [uncultured Gammaproteobacteria bacterium]